MLLRTHGFSLIDVIVGIALLLVLFLALFGLLRASLTLSTLAKAKSTAVELASTQMEYLRGLSYDAVGTVGGIPAGNVPQFATSTVDGVSYTTRTYITYYDDPADGLGAADTNGITTDYKKGKVTVSYTLYGITRSVALVSNFIPSGIETSTGGGTLQIHIVNANGENVSDASVHIVNPSTSPTVDFTTFSDASGIVTVSGATPSSQYEVFVSKSGYSSAQTYPRTSTDVNPSPGYLTVVKDQTTTATFAIDTLASLTLKSFSPATTTSFDDTFADTTHLASQTDTQVQTGALSLVSGALSGSARSTTISPSSLDGWGLLSADITAPSGTNITIHVDDDTGTPLPDTVLTGNTAGFSSFPVSLVTVATSTYPTLSLEADLTSDSTTTTPSLQAWSLSHTSGPTPSSGLSFTLTGTKTIGSDASGTPIYKTVLSDTTGASGAATESLEWDAYTLTLAGMPLIESCPASPYQLPPGSATTTELLVGTLGANTLPVMVTTASGDAISGATVSLTSGTFVETIPTSACGLAYFNDLPTGTYTANATAFGYASATTMIDVSGHTATTTLAL